MSNCVISLKFNFTKKKSFALLSVWCCGWVALFKKIFLIFLNRFNILMLKINFKNKKYFDIFPSKKHFEK
jgi:hypothetical protein